MRCLVALLLTVSLGLLFNSKTVIEVGAQGCIYVGAFQNNSLIFTDDNNGCNTLKSCTGLHCYYCNMTNGASASLSTMHCPNRSLAVFVKKTGVRDATECDAECLVFYSPQIGNSELRCSGDILTLDNVFLGWNVSGEQNISKPVSGVVGMTCALYDQTGSGDFAHTCAEPDIWNHSVLLLNGQPVEDCNISANISSNNSFNNGSNLLEVGWRFEGLNETVARYLRSQVANWTVFYENRDESAINTAMIVVSGNQPSVLISLELDMACTIRIEIIFLPLPWKSPPWWKWLWPIPSPPVWPWPWLPFCPHPPPGLGSLGRQSATDCVWGMWHDWTPCTRTCGNAIRARIRFREIEAANGGRECIGVSQENQPCDGQPPCASRIYNRCWCPYHEWSYTMSVP